MGFSDITNLHIALRQEAGLATFHGPGFGSMGVPERNAVHLGLRGRGAHERRRR